MSDPLGHECGVALVRLLKPLAHYEERYGSPLWGFFKLFLLMEKQHNRGQDGVGVGCVKFDVPAGEPFMFRERNTGPNPLDTVFRKLLSRHERRDAAVPVPGAQKLSAEPPERRFEFCAEAYLGHLRYGTSGGYGMTACHPYIRRSPWPARNLMLAGNFNLTNTAELNRTLISKGQHPIFAADAQTLIETLSVFLDEEHEALQQSLRAQELTGVELARRISEELDIARLVERAAASWDGGYALVGLLGNGDAFVVRDPGGIRPAFYVRNDEVFAVASERAALLTGFEVTVDAIREVPPGHVIVIKKSGRVDSRPFTLPRPRTACSFERIYFSRGNDPDIYKERKALGAALAEPVLEALGGDVEKSVFSFIPNTAEVAYLGLMEELHTRRRVAVKAAIVDAVARGQLSDAMLDDLVLRNWPRSEKVLSKDVKMRTFIGQEEWRNHASSHVYDITYASVTEADKLVVLDDSIVRGTTLRNSILRILARLAPQEIIIASTAPQVRYPDGYGIDMSDLGRLLAFQAAIALLHERGQEDLVTQVYELSRAELRRETPSVNHVQKLYELFTPAEIADKMIELIRPPNLAWSGRVRLLFQSIENLHAALPQNLGDWYFTGNYPTPGGYKVVNQALVNYVEGRAGRSYS
jgi:amidophosphoribosyltransferase